MTVISEPVYAQDGTTWNLYSSKGNSNTVGYDFTLQFPPSYEKVTDFSKEDYLQTFVVNDEEGSGDSIYYLTVGIHNLPSNIAPLNLQTDGIWDTKKLKELWATIAKQIPDFQTQDQAISWGNIPMAKYRVFKFDGEITFISAILYALHGQKLIKLECGFNSIGGDPDFGTDIDLTQDPTCSSYFNSLNFID
jgi:hypothetical protein